MNEVHKGSAEFAKETFDFLAHFVFLFAVGRQSLPPALGRMTASIP